MARGGLAGEILSDRVLGEEVRRYVLSSGLRVIVVLKPGYRKKFAVLGADFGSVDNCFVGESGKEETVPDGVAHFLEHKLFEQDGMDAFEVFSKQGASANAVTSFRSTCFFFHCSSHLLKNLRTLLGLVLTAGFTDRSVEKEKGIIEQEIRMYEDSADWLSTMNLVRGLYVRHAVRTDIAGTVESIRQIDGDVLRLCHRHFYHPGNMVLVVSGDVDAEHVAQVCETALRGAPRRSPAKRCPHREPKRVAQTRVSAVAAVQRPRLVIGFKDPAVPVDARQQRKRDLVTGILLDLMFGSSSRSWQQLYEEDVIDDSFYTSYAGEEDFGFLTLGCEIDDPEATRRRLFSEIRAFEEAGFSNADFGRIVHKCIGRFVRGLDSQEATSFLWLHSVLRDVEPFVVPALLRMITAEDVMHRHGELFGSRNHCTSVVRAP